MSFIGVQASVVAPTHIKKADKSCQQIVLESEQKYQIPDELLLSVARVESKLHPWAVNAQGKSRFFKTKKEAVNHVQNLKKKNVKNIGVGCMQINLSAHGKKFKSLEAAFEPENNIAYGAKLIRSLYDRFGEWDTAVRYYHTANPKYNNAYKARVYRIWNGIKSSPSNAVQKDRLKIGFGPGMGIGNRLS